MGAMNFHQMPGRLQHVGTMKETAVEVWFSHGGTWRPADAGRGGALSRPGGAYAERAPPLSQFFGGGGHSRGKEGQRNDTFVVAARDLDAGHPGTTTRKMRCNKDSSSKKKGQCQHKLHSRFLVRGHYEDAN
ncbi:hypothetical protein NDU88_005675 [Pleurodeles waltl]|uniref:Uncharacterized protein n=1 Tax=Pleurodeles waltl TaxID=8319 RepID=A0AAV7SMB6_PLEWA|nr:hypothetical protein NDU88_005675 [Pleurodeles waltl]